MHMVNPHQPPTTHEGDESMRKRALLLVLIAVSLLFACSVQQQNPFFSEYDTPHGVPPFDEIRLEHYRPAFEEGMKRQLAAIDEIVGNPEPATFENTVVALEGSELASP